MLSTVNSIDFLFQEIFTYWMEKKPVLGFHIGNIDILIEDEENTALISPDFNATISLIETLHELTIAQSKEDGLERYHSYSTIGILCLSFKM